MKPPGMVRRFVRLHNEWVTSTHCWISDGEQRWHHDRDATIQVEYRRGDGDGWYLYWPGHYFGKQLFMGFKDSLEEASKIIDGSLD